MLRLDVVNLIVIEAVVLVRLVHDALTELQGLDATFLSAGKPQVRARHTRVAHTDAHSHTHHAAGAEV